jgi:hypothetical protein
MVERRRHPPEYDVGFKKPPTHTQFQPGQSGNPKGRRKGSKNLSTIVAEEVAARVTVTVNGRRKTITMLQAAIKQLVNKAASGDQNAIKRLVEIIQTEAARAGAPPPQSEPISDADRQLLDIIHRRLFPDAGDDDE